MDHPSENLEDKNDKSNLGSCALTYKAAFRTGGGAVCVMLWIWICVCWSSWGRNRLLKTSGRPRGNFLCFSEQKGVSPEGQHTEAATAVVQGGPGHVWSWQQNLAILSVWVLKAWKLQGWKSPGQQLCDRVGDPNGEAQTWSFGGIALVVMETREYWKWRGCRMFTKVSYYIAWCHHKPKRDVCTAGDWRHVAAKALWSRYGEPQMLSIEI